MCMPQQLGAVHPPVVDDHLRRVAPLAERAVDRNERKRYFASAANGAQHVLSPELVYSMEIYEDKMDMSTFKLALLGMRFGLDRFLAGQPIQVMGKVGGAPR